MSEPVVLDVLERETPRGRVRVQLVVRPDSRVFALMVDAMERAGLQSWPIYGETIALRARLEWEEGG